MIEPIIEDLFLAHQRVVEGKNAILISPEGVALAVDTGIEPHEGAEMLAFIRDTGASDITLCLTHHHGDHVLGSGAFRGLPVVAHELVIPAMRQNLPRYAKTLDLAVEEVTQSLAWPTTTYKKTATIEVGRYAVHLTHAPGHSADSAIVHIPALDAVICADTIVRNIVPAISDTGNCEAWLDTLSRLRDLAPAILVPGHGDVVRGTQACRQAIDDQHGYLDSVLSHCLAQARRGLIPEEIADSAPLQDFAPRYLRCDRYDMDRRHRHTVRQTAQTIDMVAATSSG